MPDNEQLTAEFAPELPEIVPVPDGNGSADPGTLAEDLRWVNAWNDTGIEPLGDRILVRRTPEREKIGSIAIAEAHREQQIDGTVLATGPGRALENGMLLLPLVSPGTRVMFGRYAGVDLPPDLLGKDLVMMRGDEILAVLH